MNLKELKELFRLVEKTDFSEVEVQSGDIKVNIKRGHGEVKDTVVYREPAVAISEPVTPFTQPTAAVVPVPEVPGEVITSPFVGTFYRSPSPDAKPFVEVGSKVQKGDTLCIVEAMKLMNEIEAEIEGTVKQIYASNAQPVEFGEKLFLIE